MSDTSSTKTGGTGFLGFLGLAFIILKLTGVIGWSWWWVLAPIWIPWGLLLSLLIVVNVLAFAFGYSEIKRRW